MASIDIHTHGHAVNVEVDKLSADCVILKLSVNGDDVTFYLERWKDAENIGDDVLDGVRRLD